MKKNVRFNSIKKALNGFTLVELLAVIVVLGILITIAVPAVNSSVQKARKETFVEYTQNIISKSEQSALNKLMNSDTMLEYSCFTFSITDDLGLSDTGDFNGWVVYKLETDKYYITLYNKYYMILNYEFTEDSGNASDIKEEMKAYKKSTIEELKEKVKEEGISSIFEVGGVTLDCDNGDLPEDDDDETGETTETRVYLLDGKSFNGAIKSLASAGATYETSNSSIKHITFTDVAPAEGVATVELSDATLNQNVLAYLSGDTVNLYTTAESVYLPQDMSYMFYNFTSLIDINLNSIPSIHLLGNDKGTTKLEFLFKNCAKMTSHFDLSILETSQVTSVESLYYGCKSMVTIDVSGINTTNVTDFQYAFGQCNSATEIKTGNWSGANAKYTQFMFQYCNSIHTIDLSNFKTTENLIDMTSMFEDCTSLTSIMGITNFNTYGVLSYENMFHRCSSIVELDLSSFTMNDKNNVKLNYMFHSCNKLEVIYASNDWAIPLKKHNPGQTQMYTGANSLKAWTATEVKVCTGSIFNRKCTVTGYDWKKTGSILSIAGLGNLLALNGTNYLYLGQLDYNHDKTCMLTYRPAPGTELLK